MKKQLIIGGAVTAALAANAIEVHAADEVVEVPLQAVAETKTVTQEAVNTAKEAVVKQEEVVNATETKLNDATQVLDNAKEEVKQVGDVAQPDVTVEDVQAEIVEAEATVEKTNEQITVVTQEVEAAKQEVNSLQQADTSVVEAELKKLQVEAVVLEGEKLDAQEDDRANEKEKVATQTQLEETKVIVNEKEAEVKQLETKVNEIDAQLVNDVYPTEIKITPEWKDAFGAFLDEETTPIKREESFEEKSAKKQRLLEAVIPLDAASQALNKEGFDKFDELVKDRNGEKYDPSNLPDDVQLKLNQYFATLVNSVRKEFGIQPVQINSKMIKFANLVADNYEKRHPEVQTDNHDVAAMKAAREELKAQDGIYGYFGESIFFSYADDVSKMTLNQLYGKVYSAVNSFIFEGEDNHHYNHALAMINGGLTSKKQQALTYGIAFSRYQTGAFNDEANGLSLHALTLEYFKPELVKDVQLDSPYTYPIEVTKDTSTLKAQKSQLETQLTLVKASVVDNKSQLDDLTNQLETLSQYASKLPLVEAKVNTNHKAITKLNQTLETLNSDNANKAQLLTDAKAKLVEKTNLLNELNTQLTKAKTEVVRLNEKLTAVKKQTELKAKVNTYKKEVERLTALLATQKAALKDAESHYNLVKAQFDVAQLVNPEVKPEVKPEIKPTPVPEVVKPEVKPTPVPEVVKPEVKPIPVPEVKPEVKPTPVPEVVKPEVKPIPVPEVKPEVTPTPVLEVAKPEVKPEVKPTPVPEVVKPEVKPEVQPTLVPEVVKPEVKSTRTTAQQTLKPTLVPTSKPTQPEVGQVIKTQNGTATLTKVTKVLPKAGQAETNTTLAGGLLGALTLGLFRKTRKN